MKVWNPLAWIYLFRFYLIAARGYRWHPWQSPYLRWRMETYWGIPAEHLTPQEIFALIKKDIKPILRFAVWTAEMKEYT